MSHCVRIAVTIVKSDHQIANVILGCIALDHIESMNENEANQNFYTNKRFFW